MPSISAYKTELPYSYALGVFPSLALMQAMPRRATRLLLHPEAEGEGVQKLRTLCAEHRVREEYAEKALQRISGKGNCFAAVVFEKWQDRLATGLPHVVLVNPMDEGNLGTIQRTLLGLGIVDLAIIRPGADPFEPRVIRSSMGATFGMRTRQYEDFSQYREEFSGHMLYPFMLDGAATLEQAVKRIHCPYTLVFGNEGKGLASAFSTMGIPVRIPHSEAIDSLNLAVAVAVGTYMFIHGGKEEASCIK